MPVKKLNFSIAPLNDNPATISGAIINNGFGHKNGFPTIKFTIPAQDLLLDTQNLFLSGQLIVRNTIGGVDDSLVQMSLANRANAVTGYNTENTTATIPNINLNTSNWNGVSSVIDKVVIQSKKTQAELSSVVNYSMFDALKLGYSNNQDDYKQSPLVRNLASGTNHGAICRHLVNNPDIPSVHTSAISSKFYGNFFSFKIDVALLKTQALHLGNSFVGGLIITLHLAPDASVFHTRHRKNVVASQLSANISSASYLLKNVRLEGKYMMPTKQDLASYNPNVTLNSRVNLMNDVVSSNNSNVYTPQLSSVKSVVNVFLDDDQQNNFNMNTNNFRNPLGLVGYLHAKNNIRFPYDYQVKAVPNSESLTENATTGQGVFNPSTLCEPANSIGDCEVRRQFIKSVMGSIPSYHSATYALTCEALRHDWTASRVPAAVGVSSGLNVSPDLMGVGADYTNGLAQTQNYVNQDYELKLDSAINSGTANQPSDRSSKIVIQESFLRNFASMNLQSLVKQQ
tara:strand:- start:151 stop:1689 length:1539 start_codon:yes stop_codon:yes gene_type:complete